MPKPVARLVLARRLERALRGGHPWLYADALRPHEPLPAGAVCDVYDQPGAGGRFLARGLYTPGSPIAFRVLTLDPREAVDAGLFARRLAAAIELRAQLAALDADTDAFRLVNGEGDRLPGIVCDRYADTLVLRFDGDGPRALLPLLLPALEEAAHRFAVARIVEKQRGEAATALRGELPAGPLEIREHGLRFGVEVRHGQKTGFFLDHRENRHAVRLRAHGRDVLNVFSYTGGFSVAAAAGGARSVVSVDAAAPAVAESERNLARNRLEAVPHEGIADDAFAVLARFARERRAFDLVVLDPPSFAPSEKAVPKATEAYRDLGALGLGVLRPGGLLVYASCSSHMDEPRFLEAVREACRKARRTLQVVALTGAGPDHPFLLQFPEGRYLKTVFGVAS